MPRFVDVKLEMNSALCVCVTCFQKCADVARIQTRFDGKTFETSDRRRPGKTGEHPGPGKLRKETPGDRIHSRRGTGNQDWDLPAVRSPSLQNKHSGLPRTDDVRGCSREYKNYLLGGPL